MAPAAKSEPRPAPRLALVTPPAAQAADIVTALSQALAAGDVAAVLLQIADGDERALINTAKDVGTVAQKAGAALILFGHFELVAKSGADGAHLSGFENFDAALASLKPERIAGAGALASRDDAMTAAEIGADYVMFGGPGSRETSAEAIADRIAWWAEVFTVPCMGYATSLDDVATFVTAGADFVALAPEAWVASPQEFAAAAMARLALPEAAV